MLPVRGPAGDPRGRRVLPGADEHPAAGAGRRAVPAGRLGLARTPTRGATRRSCWSAASTGRRATSPASRPSRSTASSGTSTPPTPTPPCGRRSTAPSTCRSRCRPRVDSAPVTALTPQIAAGPPLPGARSPARERLSRAAAGPAARRRRPRTSASAASHRVGHRVTADAEHARGRTRRARPAAEPGLGGSGRRRSAAGSRPAGPAGPRAAPRRSARRRCGRGPRRRPPAPARDVELVDEDAGHRARRRSPQNRSQPYR